MHGDRGKRSRIKLADPPEGLDQNAFLGLELAIEPQRSPVAATTFVCHGAWLSAPPRTWCDQAEEIRFREPFLRVIDPYLGNVAGKDIGDEDRKPVDARNCLAASHEFASGECDFVADSH